MKYFDLNRRTFQPGLIGEVPTGNLLWVDPINGIDELAVRGRMTIPFRTLTAAKNAAEEGDTIMVLPGNYAASENLAVPGVNWHFFSGAKVISEVDGTGLFHVDESGAKITVSGQGEFECDDCTAILSVTEEDADILFEARSLKGISSVSAVYLSGAATDSEVRVRADRVETASAGCTNVQGGCLYLEAREISSNTAAIYAQGGELHVRAQRISGSGGVALYGDLVAEIEAFEIESTGAAIELYDIEGDYGVVTVRNSRLLSEDAEAIAILGGYTDTPPRLRIWNCFLRPDPSDSQILSVVCSTSAAIGFYGQNTMTRALGGGITAVGASPTIAALD